ncbi:ArnT family glycosyltransferase [Solidesulfovibrio carbinolicus]|uniref:Glycosyltransferase RgtA/B/C/D-like domain-containing protein n=1 Tax=Solidesulfovibrio carbinolicus TaxID=296842 RepID=A0A4P6HT11_9BACT|nr:glycosyltransferase family 39 protein [Solidesulfovibrio carbinolicus]QAZ69300.1 hypothetical protein C3Y92_19470 [Solidesulfovibrio carbinolicus]
MRHDVFRISYRLPRSVLAALLVFVAVHTVAICNMRGVADPQGYNFNSNKPLPVNSYEDDAQVSLMHALGYYGPTTNTFDVATNFGGPLLHGARPVIWAAAKLGFVQRFEDRSLYVLYPAEMLRIFKIFSFYKLAFLLAIPLGVFWLLRNHVSERAGVLGAWLMVSVPFLTGFELRLKPDGVVFGLTMLSMLYQLAFARDGRARHLYAAVALLAVSFAMKFTMATVVFPFAACLWAGLAGRGLRPFRGPGLALVAKAAGLGLGLFVLANPRIIPGAWIFYDFIVRYSSLNKKTAVKGDFWATIVFRLTHFEALLGKALGLVAIPAFLAAVWRSVREGRRVTAVNCLTALYVLQLLFLWFVANDHVVGNITYYYYGQSLLTAVLAALLFDWLATLGAGSRRAVLGLDVLAAGLVVATMAANLDVLRFSCGQSTRQMAQGWFEANVAAGASVGIPLAPSAHLVFSDRYLLDPFRHRILLLGQDGGETETLRPDYVFWVRSNPLMPLFASPGYEQVALFDAGRDLPREPYTFFQDDIYAVYKRLEAPVTPPAAGPADPDAALGAALAGEGDCNIVEYHASGIFPVQMTVFLRARGQYLPLGPGLFFAALRAPVSPPAYPHQLTPELLTLWGVKYLYARQDEAVERQTLADPRFALTPAELPPGKSLPEGLGLFRYGGYQGMAHFLPDAPAGEKLAVVPRWQGLLARHKLLPYGRLYPAGAAPGERNLLRVRMRVACTGRMDLLLKGAGQPLSLLLGPGDNDIDVPLPVSGVAEPGYELNAAEPGAQGEVRSIATEPMAILPATCFSADPYNAFAAVTAEAAGQVAFSLPYHPAWRAMVDGVPARPERGPGNVVTVPVGPGRHFVALEFDGTRN